MGGLSRLSAGPISERGIDILMATHNGARTLPAMLEALARLSPPKRSWRLLAVDNASTDATRPLLEQWRERLPIVVLSCETPGKTPALLAGARRVSGDLVVFTDDDVVPAPEWLAELEAAADAGPDAGLFGGRIEPAPMTGASPWFEASIDFHSELFALTDQPAGPVDAVAHIFGPNFLIRREHLDVIGQVDPDIGPTFTRQRNYAMGQDTIIIEALVRRGVAARFAPKASVKHMVRAQQTELDFMLARAERHGRGLAKRWIAASQGGLLRRMRFIAEHAPWTVTLASPRDVPSRESFNALWRARWARGAVSEALFGAR
jgi:glycosyltransferase involved in cell wall biosynthesis